MRDAFAGIIDYAGLFPPASCDMVDAVRQYDVYRRSEDRWMLNRFVLAASRLLEMGMHLERNNIVTDPADPWQLAAVMGVHIPMELERIQEFDAVWRPRGVIVDAIEYRVRSVGQIMVLSEQIPATFRRYFEVPQAASEGGGHHGELVKAVGHYGAFAKFRTGGMLPEMYPDPADLAGFLLAAVTHKVPFKTTAGLHHPWRGVHPINYEHDAEPQAMYGFAAVLVATTELLRSFEGEIAEAILTDDDPAAFVAEEGGIRWRENYYPVDELVAAHQNCFLGFGCCAFREPVDELRLSTPT